MSPSPTSHLQVEECMASFRSCFKLRGLLHHTNAPGAHKLPKAVKEHATRFHDNPNYDMHFQKFSDTVSIIMQQYFPYMETIQW